MIPLFINSWIFINKFLAQSTRNIARDVINKLISDETIRNLATIDSIEQRFHLDCEYFV